MNKLILSAAALVLATGGALAESHGGDVVRMGTEGAYPPWNYLDDNGEVAGFERELGDELCARAGLNCEWVTNDWGSIIPNLVSGNYDTIIAGMSINEDRKQVIDFTQEYTPAEPSCYVALSGDVDVDNAVIAAQTTTIQASFVAENDGTLVEFSTPEETISAVRNGEADAVLADCSYLEPIAADEADLVMLERTERIGGGVGMGLRKSDTELREMFDEAIGEMKCDGSLNALIEKWEVASTFGSC